MKTRLLFVVSAALTGILLSNAQESKYDFSKVPGVVLGHVPSTSKSFVGSPSICVLPEEDAYLATWQRFVNVPMEERGTHVMKSTDKGNTWKEISFIKHKQSETASTLFVFKNTVYFLGLCDPMSSVGIYKSTDGGLTWSQPTDEMNGLIIKSDKKMRYHTSPTPVIIANGRFWRAMEAWPTGGAWATDFGAFVMSAPVNSDILKASSWTISETVNFPRDMICKIHSGWLEGNVVERPNGKIANIMRVHGITDEVAAYVEFDGKLGKKATFTKDMFVRLPGACKKFTMRYDPISKRYYALSNWTPENMRNRPLNAHKSTNKAERSRHTLALISSDDFEVWKVDRVVLRATNAEHEAFQYVDWVFDGDDIIAISRTSCFDGVTEADNQHNSNMATFHRVKDFRKEWRAEQAELAELN